MDITGVEIGIVLCFLALSFIVGLSRREYPQPSKFCGMDLQMSMALKGVACVLILFGHYVKRRNSFIEVSPFTQLVYFTSSNIALALFMYYSGYGLSVKKSNGGGIFLLATNGSKKYISHCFLLV